MAIFPRIISKGTLTIAAALVVWGLALGYGIRQLLLFSNSAGALAQPPAEWPAGAPIGPATDRATLLVFVHPQCPCTSATIGELALIMARGRDRVQATVFLYVPGSAGPQWTDTGLWRSAAAIPGVRVFADPDASRARRFGAQTSGQTLLYDAARH